MNPTAIQLTDLPLWRLIVLVEDAERNLGPESETTRTAAKALRDRLRTEGDIGLRIVKIEEATDAS